MKARGAAKEKEPKTNANYREEDGVGYYKRNGVTVPIYRGNIRVGGKAYEQFTVSWSFGGSRNIATI